MLKVCSYLLVLCLLGTDAQQDKWLWSSKNRNSPTGLYSNQREDRKYERLEDIRNDRYAVSESTTKRPLTQNDDFFGDFGLSGSGGYGVQAAGSAAPINGNSHRYNANGFGGFPPQAFGNGPGFGQNQFGGGGQFGNQYAGQFGNQYPLNNGINQLPGNGYFPQYAQQNGGGGQNLGNGLGNGIGAWGNGGGAGWGSNAGLGNGAGLGGSGWGNGPYLNNPPLQNGFNPNGVNGGFSPNRPHHNPSLGNNAANGILVGPGGPTGQYGRPVYNGQWNRPGFGNGIGPGFQGNGIGPGFQGNGIGPGLGVNGPGLYGNSGIPGGFGNGNGFGGRPFGYGGPYDQAIPFNSKSGAGILAEASEDSKDVVRKDDDKTVN